MRRALLVGILLAVAPLPATAQELEPITDRDYAIDLYQGPVLGSAEVVGMGGASVAVRTGSAGLLVNPAAVAEWATTSTGEWDWDFHFDALNRLPGEDLDNNGIVDPDPELTVDPFLTFGVAGRISVFSAGFAISQNTEVLTTDEDSMGPLEATTRVARIAIGVNLFRETLALGVAIKLGDFTIARDNPDTSTDTPLFDLNGGGLEIGAIWTPHKQDYRLGASISTALVGDNEVELGADECDPNDCEGYILPDRVTGPWQLIVGGAWRFGGTKWNQKFGARWRDERHWLLAADVLVTGSSIDGYGVGAFAQRQLQRSGKGVSASARVGAEFEWIPGWLRIRGGSYWEPSRFEGVSGRIHGTLGVDVRLYSFCFWDSSYRLMAGLIADGAEGYGNGGVTVGFWH